ncbi:MAG TPA: PilZ domain-containing protein [Candidatus Acidoferrales bacterium]
MPSANPSAKSNEDRRIVPRKPYTMPIRFVVLTEEFAYSGRSLPHAAVAERNPPSGNAQPMAPHEGETVDVSERGVGFKSKQTVSLGQSIEMYFTLPTELTGRMPEDVRCTAKIVHVDHHDEHGFTSFGANIELFERITSGRVWGN